MAALGRPWLTLRAEPSLIVSQEGNTVDAMSIVQTYRALASSKEASAEEAEGGSKDEL